MFYKKAVLILIASALVTTQVIHADGFMDVKKTDWHFDYVNKLVSLGGMKGYEDGLFRPSDTITKAEFVSMLVRSLGFSPEMAEPGFHWSQESFKMARASGLVKTGEFNTQVDQPISRYDMALLAARALEYRKEKFPDSYSYYGGLVLDYKAIPDQYKDSVMKVLSMGVITGYPDKSFSGEKTLTRAEATVVMSRVLDPALRDSPSKPSGMGLISLNETKALDEFFIKGAEELTMPFININYTSVTQVSNKTISVEKLEIGKDLYLNVKGEPGNLIVLIAEHDIFRSVGGEWDSSRKGTAYKVSAEDCAKAEYLAFVNANEANLKMIINPFKK